MANCQTNEERTQAFNTEAQKLAAKADVSRISAAQVNMLFEFGGLNMDQQIRLWLEPILTSRAAKESLFAFYAWKYMPENDAFTHGTKETEALINFLNKGDLKQVIKENPDVAIDIFNAMPTLRDANWHTEGFADGVSKLMECQLDERQTMECVKVFNSVARVDSIDSSIREGIRQACVGHYKQLLSTLDNPRRQKACQEQITYLEGPFASGTLVGNKAPELHIIKALRQEGDEVKELDIKSLDDLKGNIVMIDFWSTKCVPCVQSFPEVAEIQNHFAGKPVVILGVTSIMGYFVDIPNKRTVQCRNNPEKELSLFPDFMKGMGMNWTVAVTQEDVMNTDYGALAIPHITILDRDGCVRYNAVNADKEQKIKLIEELLGE